MGFFESKGMSQDNKGQSIYLFICFYNEAFKSFEGDFQLDFLKIAVN